MLINFATLTIGALVVSDLPAVAFVCSVLCLVMGVVTCLAYMFIDVEQYEVERGRKAVHNPTKGQELATNVSRYGHHVDIWLLEHFHFQFQSCAVSSSVL